MSHPLYEIREKMERADHHIDELKMALRTFLGPNAYTANLRDNDGSAETQAFTRQHEARNVPIHLRILASEAIHQMRSSLDHLLCQLIRLNRREPGKRNQFPIFDIAPHNHATRDAWKEQTTGVSDAAMDFLKHVQPWRRREPQKHPLSILKSMNDADKHQTVVLSTPKTVPMLYVTWADGFVGEASDDGEGPVLMDGGLQVERKLAAQVVFPTFGTDADVPVIKGLETFWWYVSLHVLNAARDRFFPGLDGTEDRGKEPPMTVIPEWL